MVTKVRQRLYGSVQNSRRPASPLSIYENVVYGPRLHGRYSRATLDTIVEKQLRAAGLWDEVRDRLHTSASALSVGQQQRLCLARGLAVEPKVLLCDEAASALNPISAQRIEGQLLELEADYSIVLVTHVLRQAQRLADYGVYVHGRICRARAGRSSVSQLDVLDNLIFLWYISGIFPHMLDLLHRQ